MFGFLRKEKTIRDKAIAAVQKDIEAYAKWYPTAGLYLPPKYAQDPSGWNDALYKMNRAFTLLTDEDGEYLKAKGFEERWGIRNDDRVKEIEQEIVEGLKLFGENLLYLTDLPK